MFKRKAKTKTVKSEVADVVHAVSDAVRQGSATALEATAPVLREASDKVQAASQQVRPKLEELGEKGRQQLENGAHQVTQVRDKFESQVRPQLTYKAGETVSGVAEKLSSTHPPKVLEDVATRVTGDKKALKKAQKRLAKRGKQIAKNTRPKKKCGSSFLWILGVLSVVGIVYYVWKQAQPVEDPWSAPMPANNRPVDARPVGSTPASQASGIAPEVSEAEIPAAKVSDQNTNQVHD